MWMLLKFFFSKLCVAYIVKSTLQSDFDENQQPKE